MRAAPVLVLAALIVVLCAACARAEEPVAVAPAGPSAPSSASLPGCAGGEVFVAEVETDLDAAGAPPRQAATEMLALLGPDGTELARRLEPGTSETTWVVRAAAGAGEIAQVRLFALASGGYGGNSARVCGPAPTPAPAPAPGPSAPGTAEPAFGLDISNQSFARPDVRLVVTIDGHQVVDGAFPVGSQHNFYSFPLVLGPGDHELRVTVPEHNEEWMERFAVKDDQYAYLSYWGGVSDAPLQVQFSDEPFAYQ